MITIEQLLESRDRRAQRQRSLLSEWPSHTLLCLTVQLPGPVKRSPLSERIASEAVDIVRGHFDLAHEELQDLETGFEGYFLVPMSPEDAKRMAVSVEEQTRTGRLFDLDVVVADPETGVRPLGREQLGLPGRRCIICGKPVRECMRTRAHTAEDLLERYREILNCK